MNPSVMTLAPSRSELINSLSNQVGGEHHCATASPLKVAVPRDGRNVPAHILIQVPSPPWTHVSKVAVLAAGLGENEDT